MQWVVYQGDTGVDRTALLVGEELRALPAGVRLVDLLGDDGTRLTEAGEQARRTPDEVRAFADVTLLQPVDPPSIRDFSAFEEHCRSGLKALGKDLSPEWYEMPVFYFANPGSVTPTNHEVRRPGNCVHLDYELEVAAVIGRPGSDLHPAVAEEHIAGYLIYNDWSARDLQHTEMHLVPIGPAKGKDFANGLGPILVTPDELAERCKGQAYDLEMTATVNGRRYSTGNLSDIYWSFGEMLAYASRGTNLRTGEVLGGGTCGGGCILELSATYGTDKYPWLGPGDEVVLEVDRMGALRNTIVEGAPVTPLRGA